MKSRARATKQTGDGEAKAVRSAAAFQKAVVAALKRMADAKQAAGMRAYMRDQFEYLGIPTPARRAVVLRLVKAWNPMNAAELRAAAEGLWRRREREYAYAALDLLSKRSELLGVKDLSWLLDLALIDPWWDTVDALVKVIGAVVLREGHKGRRAMDRALKHKSHWIRRIAMLHQLGRKGETDPERLFAYADALAAEKEFFIRKAVGWALRDYAWHDPAAVRVYLLSARARLSGLTYREAGKHCMERND